MVATEGELRTDAPPSGGPAWRRRRCLDGARVDVPAGLRGVVGGLAERSEDGVDEDRALAFEAVDDRAVGDARSWTCT
jgi:hypothetical protein